MSPAPVSGISHGDHSMSPEDCWGEARLDLPGTTMVDRLLGKRMVGPESNTPDHSDSSPSQSPRQESWEDFLEQNVELLASKVDMVCKSLRSRDAYIRTAALG